MCSPRHTYNILSTQSARQTGSSHAGQLWFHMSNRNTVLTCAHRLEVLIVRALSCRHDLGALIFKRGPGRSRKDCALLLRALNRPVMCRSTTTALCADRTHFAKSSNATECHRRPCGVAAVRHRNYSNVILSEYRTKEITSALLGLITVCGRSKEKPEY